MTPRRMIGVALGAFALLVVAWPPRPSGRPYDERRVQLSPSQMADSLRSEALDTMRAVEHAIWMRRERDLVARTLAAMPAGARNSILVDPHIDASMRRHLEHVYAETRARMPAGMALPVFVQIDTLWLGTANTMWIEDAVGGVPTCATVVRVQVARDRLVDPRKVASDVRRAFGAVFPQPRQLGLCAFEASFGAPSPAVRRWLRERRYRPLLVGFDARYAAQPHRTSLYMDEEGFNPYYWYGGNDNAQSAVKARACAAGQVQWCTEAVAPKLAESIVDTGESASDWQGRWYWARRGTPMLMNTLAAHMGPQRFAELWHADVAPPEAYRRIMGTPMDSLAQRLLIGGTEPLQAGTSNSLASVMAVLLIAAVLAGLSTLSDPRRRR